MQVGDLVVINKTAFPEYDGKVGIIVGKSNILPNRYHIMIAGTLHPSYIHGNDLEPINKNNQKS